MEERSRHHFQPIDLLMPEAHCHGARRIMALKEVTSSTSGACVSVALCDEKRCGGNGYRS